MPCPYLEGEILKRCAALKGTMVLSVGELDNHCTTEQGFLHCEFFKRVELEDKEISKEDA